MPSALLRDGREEGGGRSPSPDRDFPARGRGGANLYTGGECIASQLADPEMPVALEALDAVLSGVEVEGTPASEAIERLLTAPPPAEDRVDLSRGVPFSLSIHRGDSGLSPVSGTIPMAVGAIRSEPGAPGAPGAPGSLFKTPAGSHFH